MPNLGYVSSFNINGNELSLKDAALTEIVEEIIEAIGANNGDISERINNLHDRSFDALIKISSVNESEISNIEDGLYKIQYVTVTGEGDNATETLNDSAILIQNGTYQYLYKDGQISSRTKTNSTWGTWAVDNHPVTSVNGMTGAVTLSIPNDSNLVHKTGNETISGTKTFGGSNSIKLSNTIERHVPELITGNTLQFDWIKIHADLTNDDLTLQQALDARNNLVTSVNGMTGAVSITIPDAPVTSVNGMTGAVTVNVPVTSVNGQTGAVSLSIPDAQIQADWNQTTTTAKDYIKNKPTIPTVPTTSTSVIANDTNPVSGGAVYNKFADLIGSAPAALDTLGEIAAALNNDADLAGTLTNQIAGKISKVSPATAGNFASLNSDGTLSDSGHKHSDYLTEAPVTSVNGMTGAVTINVGVTSFNGSTGAVTYTAPVTSVNGQTGAVTVKANVQSDWNATTGDAVILNKPDLTTYANKVTSVNGMTGAVTVNVGVTSFNGATGAVTYTAPVTSVNGQTGAVTVKANVQSDWNATSGDAVILNKPDLTTYANKVTSVNGMTGAVNINVGVTSFNGATGAVTYTAPVTSVNGATGAVNLTIPTVNNSTVTITMNGNTVGTFTLNKSGNTTIDLGTVLTSHQSIKTINNQTITGSGNVSLNTLPTVSASDNGKVLMVVNGAWQLVSPVTLYSGSGTPANSQGNNGDLYVQS